MRLVEGEFPDYRGVIPKLTKYRIAIGRDALQNSIKRAAIFSNERYHGVKLSLANGSLTISSTSPEMGEATEAIDVDYRGAEFSVGFNAVYLLQALTVIAPEGDVELGLTDEASPVPVADAGLGQRIQLRRDADAPVAGALVSRVWVAGSTLTSTTLLAISSSDSQGNAASLDTMSDGRHRDACQVSAPHDHPFDTSRADRRARFSGFSNSAIGLAR